MEQQIKAGLEIRFNLQFGAIEEEGVVRVLMRPHQNNTHDQINPINSSIETE